MKKLLPIILLLISLSAIAQKQNNRREQIKALKVSFITERLDLSEKEAQKFWSTYNEFNKKRSQIKYKNLKMLWKETREKINTISNEEANEIIKKTNTAENELHKLKINFHNKLTNILPPKKIILLKIAEEDFRRKILEEFKKRKWKNIDSKAKP